jgi:hypothetical protein
MSLVGGAAGIGTAAVLGHNKDISSGTVAAIQWGSIWGSWFGFAVSALAGQEEGDGPLASTLVGGNIGLITSAALAHRWNLTSGRPWLVSAIGLAGLLAGIGLDLIIEPDDIQGAIVPPLAGSIVGLLTGVSMTRPKGASLSIVSSEREHAALLQFAHRKLVVGEPVVIPTIQPKAAVGGKIGWQPAFRIPLVSVALP